MAGPLPATRATADRATDGQRGLTSTAADSELEDRQALFGLFAFEVRSLDTTANRIATPEPSAPLEESLKAFLGGAVPPENAPMRDQPGPRFTRLNLVEQVIKPQVKRHLASIERQLELARQLARDTRLLAEPQRSANLSQLDDVVTRAFVVLPMLRLEVYYALTAFFVHEQLGIGRARDVVQAYDTRVGPLLVETGRRQDRAAFEVLAREAAGPLYEATVDLNALIESLEFGQKLTAVGLWIADALLLVASLGESAAPSAGGGPPAAGAVYVSVGGATGVATVAIRAEWLKAVSDLVRAGALDPAVVALAAGGNSIGVHALPAPHEARAVGRPLNGGGQKFRFGRPVPEPELSNRNAPVRARLEFLRRHQDLLGPYQRKRLLELLRRGLVDEAQVDKIIKPWEKTVDEQLRAGYARDLAPRLPFPIKAVARVASHAGGEAEELTRVARTGQRSRLSITSVTRAGEQVQIDEFDWEAGVPREIKSYSTLEFRYLRASQRAEKIHELQDQMERNAVFARDWKLDYFEWEVPPDLVEPLERQVVVLLPRELRAFIRLSGEGLFR